MSRDPYERDRRIGSWTVNTDLLIDNLEIGAAIQRDVVILHVERDPIHNRVKFYGIGPVFEIVPEGCETPQYEPWIARTGEGVRVTEWKRL